MPAQLDLFVLEGARDLRSIWAQLPQAARAEIIELFAALLVASVRASTTPEEAAHEPLED